MKNYRCASCGKRFDPEKDEICPGCGAAVAPSVLTRIERKRTAVRLRAEGKMNYDTHCHEDETWNGSDAARNHRAAVRSHEASLRDNYAAHSAADNPNRAASPAPPTLQARVRKRRKSLIEKLLEKPMLLMLLIFLFFVAFALLMVIIPSVVSILNGYESALDVFLS